MRLGALARSAQGAGLSQHLLLFVRHFDARVLEILDLLNVLLTLKEGRGWQKKRKDDGQIRKIKMNTTNVTGFGKYSLQGNTVEKQHKAK